MPHKVGDIVYVEGCPCEVLETNTEWGIITGGDGPGPWPLTTLTGAGRMLVIAPDGSFVLPNPFIPEQVDHTHPNHREMTRHLQRLALALTLEVRAMRHREICPT